MNTMTYYRSSSVSLASDVLVRAAQKIAGAFRSKPVAQPEAARAAEAASVREMALRYQSSDPGFAADLMAAADRHEMTGGDGR